MTKVEALNIIKEFVEGEIDVEEFRTMCLTNNSFRDIIKDYNSYNIKDKYNNNLLNMIDKCNWKNFDVQRDLQLIFTIYLYKNSTEKLIPTNKYAEKCSIYGDLVPEWLPDDAMTFVDEEIIAKAPEELSEKDKKKWIKEQIKKTFKYEKRPPEFAQEGMWPQDEDGNFLVFRKQKQKGELVTYTFVNPKTKEEVEFQELY
ncbi:MAG: hypothetical protein ACI4T2_04295 [Christensenellales bacterium]